MKPFLHLEKDVCLYEIFISFLDFSFVYFLVLGIEPSTPCVLGKPSTTERYPQALDTYLL